MIVSLNHSLLSGGYDTHKLNYEQYPYNMMAF